MGEMSQMVKFTIRKGLCENVYVGLYYEMVVDPQEIQVSSAMDFNW